MGQLVGRGMSYEGPNFMTSNLFQSPLPPTHLPVSCSRISHFVHPLFLPTRSPAFHPAPMSGSCSRFVPFCPLSLLQSLSLLHIRLRLFSLLTPRFPPPLSSYFPSPSVAGRLSSRGGERDPRLWSHSWRCHSRTHADRQGRLHRLD